jgi:hypothetical protein
MAESDMVFVTSSCENDRKAGERAARQNRERKQAGANLEQIELRQDKVYAVNARKAQ